MGITRSLRGVGSGHTEGEGSRLHELPEAVKFLELAIIRTDGGRRKPDATLGGADETTDRRECAAVADSRNHLFGEDRPVGETVHTLDGRDMVSKVAAGWHICFAVAQRLLDGDPIGPIRGSAARNHGWDELKTAYAERLAKQEE